MKLCSVEGANFVNFTETITATKETTDGTEIAGIAENTVAPDPDRGIVSVVSQLDTNNRAISNFPSSF